MLKVCVFILFVWSWCPFGPIYCYLFKAFGLGRESSSFASALALH